MKSQIDILISAKTYDLASGKVTLKPFKFKLFGEVTKVLERYFEIFTQGKKVEIINEEGKPEMVVVDKSTFELISELMEKSQEDYQILKDLNFLLEVSTGLSSEEIGDFGFDEIIYLLTELFEENRGFFSRIWKKLGGNQAKQPAPDKSEKAKIGESESAD